MLKPNNLTNEELLHVAADDGDDYARELARRVLAGDYDDKTGWISEEDHYAVVAEREEEISNLENEIRALEYALEECDQ